MKRMEGCQAGRGEIFIDNDPVRTQILGDLCEKCPALFDMLLTRTKQKSRWEPEDEDGLAIEPHANHIKYKAKPSNNSPRRCITPTQKHDEEDGRWLREEEGQLRQMLGYQMDSLPRLS
jgi:hypothetical protein